ncbi:hypothetical protein EDD18DRAFT_1108711 [Armillaria luteobubalina]|uniref:Uncharacterized protein n=1 Tax=Armillaria luteobubalina TaxID=153913 RepID=A0AA39PZW2_9AGAR|nr:hypothetical protein EDD18DRAFT_1108711 [Armillaria luteobubalina]
MYLKTHHDIIRPETTFRQVTRFEHAFFLTSVWVQKTNSVTECRQSGRATREIPSTHHLVATSVLQRRAFHVMGYVSRRHQRGHIAILGGYRPIPPNITHWVMARDDCRSEDVEGRRQDMSPVGCIRILPYTNLLQQDQASAPVQA